MKKLGLTLAIMVSALVTGCMTNSKEMMLENMSQVETRSYQTKTYNAKKDIVAKAATSAFQDLGFIIDKADFETGTLTATKLGKLNSYIKMTVVIRSKNDTETTIRTNAQFAGVGSMPEAVQDPEMYQAFFNVVDKSLFLTKEGM